MRINDGDCPQRFVKVQTNISTFPLFPGNPYLLYNTKLAFPTIHQQPYFGPLLLQPSTKTQDSHPSDSQSDMAVVWSDFRANRTFI